ncbi:MAG TPA: hypothetical protein VN886_02365, partial [Acidimicrobiales bacterium]|nr:hypothetical protein [Acidimicrobiales bacterium]
MTEPQSAALALLAALVLEDGRRWGEAAVPEQWEDSVAVLSGDVPYHFLTRARGYSKTTDLGGIAIAVMLAQLPAGSRLYGLAADQDQGRLLIDSIDGFRVRTPEIASALTVQANRAVATSGSTLDVLPADDAGAWGLRPAFLIVDELAQWGTTRKPRAMWEAVTSAMPKVKGSRMVVLTSSGDPVHWSHGVLEHAYADDLWRVHEVRGAPPWASPERLEEQRRRLPISQFARLFLNEWTASEDRLTSVEDLRACVTLDGPLPPQPGVSYVCGLDLGLKNDRTVAAICHSERVQTSEGSVVGVRVPLDRMEVWQGTRRRPVQLSDVEDWLLQAHHSYRPLRV